MRLIVFLFFALLFSHTSYAQLDKRELDTRMFELDLYPFEVVKYDGKLGFQIKYNYDKQNAINYFSRNFNYNLKKDTLLRSGWLAPPVYDRLEKWTYGIGLRFIAGIRGDITDLYTFKGELLGKEISNLSISITGEEKNNTVITMQSGKKWKWFYEGDFYQNDIPFYYRSPEYDRLELVTDTIAGTYSFKTGEPGRQIIYNEVGHLIFAEKGVELSNTEIVQKAGEEKKKAEVVLAQKTTTKVKKEKAKKEKKEEPKETPEELSAKEKTRLYQQRLNERDKMISYVFYNDSTFFGLKTANGKVIVHPVMDIITISYPVDFLLQEPGSGATILFKMYGQEYEIRTADFGGPDVIDCYRSGTGIKCQLRWNKAERVYGFE